MVARLPVKLRKQVMKIGGQIVGQDAADPDRAGGVFTNGSWGLGLAMALDTLLIRRKVSWAKDQKSKKIAALGHIPFDFPINIR